MPLHSSPAGLRFGRTHGCLSVTNDVSDRLVRLPLWVGLEADQGRVIDVMSTLIRAAAYGLKFKGVHPEGSSG
jgi:dTDP-4-amino-4,6-dideoxygalactose transaminase